MDKGTIKVRECENRMARDIAWAMSSDCPKHLARKIQSELRGMSKAYAYSGRQSLSVFAGKGVRAIFEHLQGGPWLQLKAHPIRIVVRAYL